MQETGPQKIDIDEVEKQMRLWVDDVIGMQKMVHFGLSAPIRASCSSALGLSRLFFALIAYL
jgi:hypothetical protein